MTGRYSKTGLVLAGIYGALTAASIGYILYRIHWKPASSEFCGLPLVLLTSPWSQFTSRLLDAVNYNFDLSVYLNILTFLPGALLNSWLAYRFGALIEPRK